MFLSCINFPALCFADNFNISSSIFADYTVQISNSPFADYIIQVSDSPIVDYSVRIKFGGCSVFSDHSVQISSSPFADHTVCVPAVSNQKDIEEYVAAIVVIAAELKK
jgi:hypothetical protein